MKQELVIRKATSSDIEEIIKWRVSLLVELKELTCKEEEDALREATKVYLETALAQNKFISYLAYVDGEAVSVSGMVLFERPPYLENLDGREAYILNMYTVPACRGNGLARRLLEHCIEECKRNRVKRIWLHASDDGSHLYEKMGFVKKEKEMELYIT